MFSNVMACAEETAQSLKTKLTTQNIKMQQEADILWMWGTEALGG